MGAIVNNYYKNSIIIFIIFALSSCNNNKIPLQDLNTIHFNANPETDIVRIGISGETTCPVFIILQMDNKPYDTIVLNGKIDTFYMDDWYENDLSFKVYPIDCIKDNTFAEVKLYK